MKTPTTIPSAIDFFSLATDMKAGEVPGFLPTSVEAHVHGKIGNLYWRLLPIKHGTLVVGKAHKEPHLAILLSGTLLVKSAGETEGKVLQAGWFGTGEAGSQRLGFGITDCLFLTVHEIPSTQTVEDIDSPEWENAFVFNPEVFSLSKGEIK